MLVIGLTLAAALVVALGEVVQQRSAAQAPPQGSLSWRLLWWLVRQPLWLAGLVCSVLGNSLFSVAVGKGTLALVEAVFVARLLFALVLAAAAVRRRVPWRDIGGALAIAAGIVAFLLAAQPQPAHHPVVPPVHWALGGGIVVAVALVLAVLGKRLRPARNAVVLGAGAGMLFGLQASLTQAALHVLTRDGVLALLSTWSGYADVVVALLGMLMVQSAYAAAPLSASYPAVVTTELVVGIGIGVGVIGGVMRTGPLVLTAALIALLVMICGIYLLTTSPLVTGQLDELIRQHDVGEATQLEQRLARELRWVERTTTRGRPRPGRLRHERRQIDEGIRRLCRLQDEIRAHRTAELERIDRLPDAERAVALSRSRTLREREVVIDEQADRLREHADALADLPP